MNKHTHGSQNTSNQGFDFVEDIRLIFQSNMVAPWLDDIYKPFDFFAIAGPNR